MLLAFFISRGMIKTGFGHRVALLFMRLLDKKTIGLGYGLAITELVVAPACMRDPPCFKEEGEDGWEDLYFFATGRHAWCLGHP